MLALAPAVPAAQLASIQTGEAAITTNGTTSVTITAVDTTKAFLVFSLRSNSNRPVGSTVRGRLASSTSVEFLRNTDEGSPTTITARWFVAAFASGISVQRGEVALSATTVNVALSDVGNTNRAFVLWSKSCESGGGTSDENDFLLSELTSTTNLQFRANQANATNSIGWQVVVFDSANDAVVQRGIVTTMGTANTMATATIPTPVDVDRTFVLVDAKENDSAGNVAIGARMLRARLTNASTITVDRGATDGINDIQEISWQAIELKDGSTVRHGATSFTTGTAQATPSFASPVRVGDSIALSSVQSPTGQSNGSTPYVADDVVGVSSFTFMPSVTGVTIDRANTVANADVGWFVVNFRRRRHILVQ
jgi:hypothetical protein